ncbi:MAG TPA: hypothetical protein VN456_08590 [Desulfosporosinus sp.]|nr:hypothetical protein [Desulfosporosinus sp.]
MELDSITFDQFIKSTNPFNNYCPDFDLNGYTLITPTGLVSLSAIIHFFTVGGVMPTVRVSDKNVRGYLIRSRFVETVFQFCDFDPPISPLEISLYEVPRGNNEELFEVTKIDNPSTLRFNLKKIVDMLENKFHYPSNEASDITAIISEISQNIYDHTPGSYGFIALQTYRTLIGTKFLEVGLADFGAGILTTLKRNPKFAYLSNDMDAIEKAIELGTSQYQDKTRGTGLYHLMETIKKHSGTVQIMSGQAKFRCRFDAYQTPMKFPVSNYPGVSITIKIDSK